MFPTRYRALLLPLVVTLLCAAGCGGGGKSSGTPNPTGSATLRGTVLVPAGQSASDVVVQVQGTAFQAQPAPDGSFVIDGVPPGSYTLSTFSVNGGIGAQVTVVVGSGEVRVPEIHLAPAGQIAGIVTAFSTEGTQQPRGGAVIVASPASDVALLDAGIPPQPAALETAAVDPAVRLTATSAADGTFAIKGVAPGPYRVTATLGDSDTEEQFVFVAAGRTAVADFTFGRPVEPGPGRLTGRVTTRTAEGALQPVAGAHVMVDWGIIYADGTANPPLGPGQVQPGSPNASTMPVPMPPYPGDAVTDETGCYTLACPRGHRTVRCRHRDYLPASAEVVVGAATTLDFTLEPAPGERPRLEVSAATGKASYARGEPVEMSMALKNVGAVPVTLTFDGQEAGFTVLRGEEPVWSYGSWYPGPIPLPAEARSRRRATTTFDAVLGPGDTREYRVSWDQRGYDGFIVQPGEFTLRGTVAIGGALGDIPVLTAPPVIFRITP